MTSPADRVAHIRSLVGVFNRHDVACSVEHLAAAATWSRGDGTSLHGRDNLAARLGDFFAAFPDASLTPTHMLAIEPNAVVVEWVLEGTHLGEWRLPGRQEPIPSTGRAVRAVGADLFGFNPAGEIESDEARIDVATLVTQSALYRARHPRRRSSANSPSIIPQRGVAKTPPVWPPTTHRTARSASTAALRPWGAVPSPR